MNFSERTKIKFSMKICCATTTLTVGIQQPKVGPVGPTRGSAESASQRLPTTFGRVTANGAHMSFLTIVVALYKPAGCEREFHPHFNSFSFPLQVLLSKFIQALIVSLKFKHLVAYTQVALVKLTGGRNFGYSNPRRVSPFLLLCAE